MERTASFRGIGKLGSEVVTKGCEFSNQALEKGCELSNQALEKGCELSNQAIESAKTVADDLELTINAFTMKKLGDMYAKTYTENNIHKKKTASSSRELFDDLSASASSFSFSNRKKKTKEIVRKIKKKIRLKTKKNETQKFVSSSMKCATSYHSYEARVKYLAAKMSDDRVLTINVILVDDEENNSNNHEILPFEFNIRDKISVKELMNKISQFANDPNLRNKNYRCLCLDNAFVLEMHEPLQSYFLPSKQNQFAIAVPVGKTCKQMSDLALPIMNKTRRQSLMGQPLSNNKLNSVISMGDSDLRRSSMLVPRLLEAAQCDSMQSTISNNSSSNNKAPPTEICIPDVVYMIMAILFIFVMHGSSNKETSCN